MRGHVTGTLHSDSHTLLCMTEGRLVSAKFDNTTWRSEWMPRLEKFSENALKASSSRNRTLEGEGSVDEEALERRRFRVWVDLRLGSIDTTNINRFKGRKREEQSEKSQAIQIYQIYEKRVRMHKKCMNMWHAKQKDIMGSAQSNPTSTQAYYTYLNAWKYH